MEVGAAAGAAVANVGVWVFPARVAVPAPESRPQSRAALELLREGHRVVFFDRAARGRASGLEVAEAGWVAVSDVPLDVVYDRFPSGQHRESWLATGAELEGIPVGNPRDLMERCRDKALCQTLLEGVGLQMPPQETDPARFAERLADWGAAFLKPRFGACGVGVRRVLPGDAVPGEVFGLAGAESALLQQAVPPPTGLAGCSMRVLVQREERRWMACPPVARRSLTDPVVNVSRGADAVPADVLGARTVHLATEIALAAAEALAAPFPTAVELGVDLVVDPDGRPWIIEVNGRPNGRLEALAAQDARFAAAHEAACARPLRALARLEGPGGSRPAGA